MLHSAPVAPFRGVYLKFSLRCLGCSCPLRRVLPRTILSGALGRAPLRPRCSNPGRLFVVFSPLPRTLQSVAPGSPPDDPVRGLVPCFIPPRLLQSGASFLRILSVASDAPVRGTCFSPGRSSPGASAVLHSAPVAPFRGVFLTYSLRCLECSSPWHRILPRTIQSRGLGRAPLRPGCCNPGRLFDVFSPLPRMLQSVVPGSSPDDPVRGLVPCFIPPRLLHSGASSYRILSVASDAPVRGTWFSPGRSSPGAWAVLRFSPDAPIRGAFLSYSVRCLGRSSPWLRVHPRTMQSGGSGHAPLRPGCCNPGRHVSFSLCCLCWRLREWCFGAFFFRAPFVVAPLPLPSAPLSLAPCPVPRFVVCCARFLGSRHPVAVVAWHLSSCRGCGRRRASLACLVAPRWCTAPRPVRSLSVLRSAFPSPWCLPPPRGLSPPALLGGCAGHVEAGREPGSCACRWPLPRQGRWALSASYPFGAPRWGYPWRVPPASVLGCVRCGGLACVDPITDASGFPYRPSCDGGLSRCTGAVSCGRRHRPFRDGGRHARVPRVCACACPAWPGRAGRPPGRVLVPLTFPLAFLGSLFACSAPSGLGLPCLWLLSVFFCFFSAFLFPFPPSLRLCCVLLCVFSGPGCFGPWRLVPPPFPPPLVLSGVSCFPVARGLCAPPPPFFFFLCFLFFLFPFFFASCAVRGWFVCLWPSGVPACASLVLSLSLLTVR